MKTLRVDIELRGFLRRDFAIDHTKSVDEVAREIDALLTELLTNEAAYILRQSDIKYRRIEVEDE